jgi:proline racemase
MRKDRIMPTVTGTTWSQRIKVIDSHTAGEPTRVVVSGGPPLGDGSLADRCRRFREGFDHYRAAIVNEPHGSDIIVGALLTEPSDPSCTAGAIFFNNVGYLGMCGHGTMGLAVTLAHLGRIKAGSHRIETPVGVVTAELHADGAVTVANVPSYLAHPDVTVDVAGFGPVRGDIAWGGNWFFLTEASDLPLDLAHVSELTDFAWRVRQSANQQGYPEVDHIELVGPGQSGGNARNFVLCPGKAYDRSPCGTGTSAKLATLAARGQLREDEPWVQESLIGSTFTAQYERIDAERIRPFISGRAYVNAESTLLVAEDDPYRWGIHP